MVDNKQELLLTLEEMHNVPSDGTYIQWKVSLLKAQLAKAEPLIRKDERERILDIIRTEGYLTTTQTRHGFLVTDRLWQALKKGGG